MSREMKQKCSLTYAEPSLSFISYIGGVPFGINPKTGDLEWRGKSFIIKAIFSVLITFPVAAIIVWIIASNGGNVLETITLTSGFTVVDMILSMSISFACTNATIFMARELLRMKEKFMEIQTELDTLGVPDAVGRRVKRYLRKKLLQSGIIIILVSLIFPFATYKFTTKLHDNMPQALVIPFIVSAYLGILLTYSGPIAHGSCLKSLFYLKMLEGIVSTLTDDLDRGVEAWTSEEGQARTETPKPRLSPTLLYKLDLILRLGDKVAEMLSPLLMCHFIVVSFAGTITLYCLSIIVFGNVDLLRCLNTLYYTLLVVWYLASLYAICSAGQELENSRFKLVRKIDDTIMADKSCAHLKLEPNLSILRARMNESEWIKPWHLMTVNNKGFIATVGTISTYFIVLMQFRAAE